MRRSWLIVLQLIWALGIGGMLGAPARDVRAQNDMAAGVQALRAGEYGLALRRLHAAQERRPFDPEIALALAQAQLGRRELSLALENALNAHTGLRGRRRAEASACIGEASAGMGLFEQARSWWAVALQMDAGNRRARLAWAAHLDAEERLVEAAAHLRALLAFHPDDAEAAYRLGLMLVHVQPKEAYQAWEPAGRLNAPPWSMRAKQLAPLLAELNAAPADATRAAARLSAELIRLGELRPALRLLEQIAPTHPDSAELHAYRGYLLAALGRPALAAFEQALALDPDLVLAHYFLGRYYVQQGSSTLARQEFAAALERDRENPALGIEIGLTYAQERQYALAERWLDAAILRAPASEAIYAARARFYIERAYRVADRGLPAADELLARWPASGEGYLLRGQGLYLVGRLTEAATTLARAVELMPYQPAARLYLGLTLVALGQPEEGRAQLERAIDLDPTGLHGRRAHAALAETP